MTQDPYAKYFPGKLRLMLDQAERLGLSHGASWVSDGCAFAIHDPDVFMNDISPQFFDKQTHLRSFHRQLSIWGFSRLENGAGGRGVWYHKYFIRDKPELVKHIKRIPVKNPKPAASAAASSSTVKKTVVPDYTNYQLPKHMPFHTQHEDSGTAKNSNSVSTQPKPVHQPRINSGPVGVPAGPPVGRNYMPPPMASHHMQPPPSYASMHPNPAYPAPAAVGSRYPPFILTNFQPPNVASMHPRVMLPQISGGSLPSTHPPVNDPIGEVAQQLLACRYNSAQPQPPLMGGGRNDRLNAALLALLMESQEGAPGSNPGANLTRELIAALARRGDSNAPNSNSNPHQPPNSSSNNTPQPITSSNPTPPHPPNSYQNNLQPPNSNSNPPNSYQNDPPQPPNSSSMPLQQPNSSSTT